MITPSITVDQVIVAIGAFMQPLMPDGTQIVRTWVNRVAAPNSPFVVLTELTQTRLATTVEKYYNDGADKADFYKSTRIDVQADFYGDQSSEMCHTVQTLFRSSYAAEKFPENIRPLYCSGGTSSALITGEQQYEDRWTLTLSLQYNPVMTVESEQFENVGDTSVIAADLIPIEE